MSDRTYLVTIRLEVKAPDAQHALDAIRSRLWRLGRKPTVTVRSVTGYEDVLIREKAA